MIRTVGIYLFDEVEVLDFAGPFEVFCTANRIAARLSPSQPAPFSVITIAEIDGTVHARGGLAIQPQATFSSASNIDILLIPGGVVSAELEKSGVIDWIRKLSDNTLITASVCTGAFLLAKAGLVDGLPVTTHWEDIPDLVNGYPQVMVKENVRWIDNGKIITSAGISAGLDMSLHLVERLVGRDVAKRTARQMDYSWQDIS